ncbi:MAG TPA: methyltransferase domain-containing protein [Gammaproteobacteria bacterium]|nr:methyltransferase domain-containing protein [Gammaproteobacteria bacterium]
MSISLDAALPEKRAARRAFDRARAFDDACFLHDEARSRLLERLELVRLTPQVAIDLGCATARGANALAVRYPAARVLAVDSSGGMLRSAAGHARSGVSVLGGDAELLPLQSHCADLVLANLVLPWCRPDRLFAESARVLAEGGALLFATLGPDSLQEVRAAFGGVDDHIHVHAAFDMHDLGDLALAAGLAEPVLDVDRLEVTYADVAGLVRDLRGAGAVNVAGGRRRSLTGRERWRRFEARLVPPEGRLAVTVELILGQAWGRGRVDREGGHGPRGGGEVLVPLDRIGRRFPSGNT